MKVRIKSWQKMVNEYRVDTYGDIDLGESYFPRMLEKSMPPDRIIGVTQDSDNDGWYDYVTKDKTWIITPKMIAEYLGEGIEWVEKVDKGEGAYFLKVKPFDELVKIADRVNEAVEIYSFDGIKYSWLTEERLPKDRWIVALRIEREGKIRYQWKHPCGQLFNDDMIEKMEDILLGQSIISCDHHPLERIESPIIKELTETGWIETRGY